jgi:nitrogen-specific signal transduction histidine kinase
MSPEVLANLFSPVRSTKEGPHQGLGLSIVHGLVKKIGGMIACRSSRAGTAFEILLPARSGAGAASAAKPRAMDSV